MNKETRLEKMKTPNPLAHNYSDIISIKTRRTRIQTYKELKVESNYSEYSEAQSIINESSIDED